MKTSLRMRLLPALLIACVTVQSAGAQDILIPMDARQTDHLKAYGVAYWILERGRDVDWLLNYRGGSFLTQSSPELERELRARRRCRTVVLRRACRE